MAMFRKPMTLQFFFQFVIFLFVFKSMVFDEMKCGKPGHTPLCPYFEIKESYYEGDEVNYYCKERNRCYSVDKQTRTCLPNGTWSGTIPSCYAEQTLKSILLEPLVSGLNMNLLVDKNKTTCLETNLSTVSVWEIAFEKVAAIKIVRLDIFTNSTIEVWIHGKLNSSFCGRAEGGWLNAASLIIVCPSELEGVALRITVYPNSFINFIFCEISVYSSYGAAACLKADTPLNAWGNKQVGTNNNPTLYIFRCNQGYELIGDSAVKCQLDGTWSSSLTLCRKKKMCEDLPHVANGVLHINSSSGNRTAWLVCNEGFMPLTHDRIVCLQNGKWDYFSLNCIPIECDGNPVLPFGKGYLIDGNALYGSRLQIQCDFGYVASGSNLRQCQQNASWGILDICVEVTCGAVDKPETGEWIPLNYPSILVLRCDPGYYIQGYPPVMQCLPNGSWSHTEAVCQGMTGFTTWNNDWTTNTVLVTALAVAAGTTVCLLGLAICILMQKKRYPFKSTSTVFPFRPDCDNNAPYSTSNNEMFELRSSNINPTYLPEINTDPVYAQPFENNSSSLKEDLYAKHIYAEPIDSQTANNNETVLRTQHSCLKGSSEKHSKTHNVNFSEHNYYANQRFDLPIAKPVLPPEGNRNLQLKNNTLLPEQICNNIYSGFNDEHLGIENNTTQFQMVDNEIYKSDYHSNV